MRLSDLMGRMDLWVWPAMAMVIFLTVFTLVLVRVFRAGAAELDHNANIPLHDGTEPVPAAQSTKGGTR